MPEAHDYTRPDFSAAALVTIDTQAGTLGGRPLEVPGTDAILPTLGSLASAFRNVSRPIVHIVRIYRPDGRNADLCRRSALECGARMLLEGSPDCQLAPGLLPQDARPLDCARLLSGGIQKISANEVVIFKPRWGAFYKTPLEDHLKELGITTLVFGGSNFPNCPRTSIYEASERDFRIVVATDALSGLYDRGITELKNIGVHFLTVADLIDKLKRK
jgi:nicotinamidase-related amidase